jgi:hypothetical protein
VKFKKWWLYLGLLLGIAGFWRTIEWGFPKKTAEEKRTPLFKALEADKIGEIKWERGPERVDLKNDWTWTIINPIMAVVDDQRLTDILQTLSNLRPERSLYAPVG